MNARRPRLLTTVLLALLPAVPLAGQAEKSQSFMGKVDITAEAIAFYPQGQFTGFTMLVSGPDHFRAERHFSGDDLLALPVKTDRGALADGSYTIELTAHARISDEARAALEKTRTTGNRDEVRRMLARAGLDRQWMVHTMTVSVVKGRFADPASRESERQGRVGPSDTDEADRAALLPAVEGSPTILPASFDPRAVWHQATFRNAATDGSVIALEGYVRQIAVSGAVAPLFHALFRRVDENGSGVGPWYERYFQESENGFRLLSGVDAATVGGQPALFDYVSAEGDPVTDAGEMVFFHIGSGSIDGSLCVGFDCVSAEAFGFDTIRMKENNTRLHFDDTSSTASFPSNDWEIQANQSTNGGASWLSFVDRTAGRNVFTVAAGARSNALFVDAQGDVGIGTGVPALDIDIKTGDTPSVRLQQDGTSGFAPQTWDVAGNEAGFFVRDATSGSTLPLRIRPGSPSSSIDIRPNQIGIYTASPTQPLHLRRTDGTTQFLIEEANATTTGRVLLKIQNNGPTRMQFNNTAGGGGSGNLWNFAVDNGNNFNLDKPGVGAVELALDNSGNLTVTGTVTSGGPTCGGGCDRVFEPSYDVESIEEHAASMWANKHLPAVGPTPEGAPFNLTEKTGGMLNELEKAHIYIEQLHRRLAALEARLTLLEGKP